MRALGAFMTIALASTAMSQVATTLGSAGGTFTITANSYTGAATSLGGSANFFCNGVTGDYAFRDMWAYRIAGDSREYMVKSNNATFSNTGNTFDAQMFKGQNGSDSNALIRIDVHYGLFANSPTSPVLNKCVTITNLTSSTLSFSLFHYMDYDVPGSSNDFFSAHNYNVNDDLIQQRDTVDTGNYMETFFAGTPPPLLIRHGLLYSSLFTNTTIDNLNMSFDPGQGDFGVGFQIDGTLDPGQTSVCPGCYTALNGSAVPEPTSALLILSGLPVLLLRKRKPKGS